MGKLRFVISLESQEQYTIINNFLHDNCKIFSLSFHLEVTYIDGGITITFSVVTSSVCKPMLITDSVNLGSGRRNSLFVTSLIILLPGKNEMKSFKTHALVSNRILSYRQLYAKGN